MSGWDYRGFAIKNGEREFSREDCIVYPEKSIPDNTKENEIWAEHHLVLGTGIVRLCTKKYDPYLYVDGEHTDLSPYILPTDPEGDIEVAYAGEVHGHTFRIQRIESENHALHLELIEPDGTEWKGIAFYSGIQAQFPHEVWSYACDEDGFY